MDRWPTFRSKQLTLLFFLAFALFFAPNLSSESRAADRGQYVRVKVKLANIRSGPGTRYKKLWTAPRNYPYRVIRRKGRWLKVKDYAGYEEWIFAPLADRKPAVVVKVSTANVRRGPGRKHPINFTAERGVPLRVLSRKRGWLKVRHADGDVGWIYAKLVWGKLP